MEIIWILFGVITGALSVYLILRPTLNRKNKINREIEESNQELQHKNQELLSVNNTIEKQVIKEEAKLQAIEKELQSTMLYLSTLKEQADINAKTIFDNAIEIMQTNLEQAAIQASEKHNSIIEEYNQDYELLMREAAENYQNKMKEMQISIDQASTTLGELTEKISAAIAANIREEEKKQNISFYTIGLSQIDKIEINKIREVIPFLRNARPIAKAIWECYYRNATNDLVNRVVGSGTHIGIYRITSLIDNKIYIGQARDIRDRLITHIKCGLGIDTPNNKLYSAMLELGVENFTFEIVEECDVNLLNDREKYWIEYYQSRSWGYNMTGGGARQ